MAGLWSAYSAWKVRPMKRKLRCLHCKSTELKARGLCYSCYHSAYHAIKQGKTTWALLEKAGLVSPHARPITGFRDAFESSQNKRK